MRNSGCCVGELMTMEVPLAWQDLVPLTCFSGMDGDNTEDVPPSPTPDPICPALGAGTLFQRGFLDCAQEALRFLTDEEGMSEDSPVVVGLRQHLVHAAPSLSPATFTCSMSTHPSERGRFAPYTVPSNRSLALGHPRRGAEKPNVASLLSERDRLQHRWSASSIAPSAQRMEHVLTDELISSDDLQGVLRCLESAQSHADYSQHQRSLSSTLSFPTLHQLPVRVETGVNGEEERMSSRKSSLDDSGVSEASSADLADEADSMDSQRSCTAGSDCDTDIITSRESVSVSVLDCADSASTFGDDKSGSGDSVCLGRCVKTDKLINHETLPTNSELSSAGHSHHSLPIATTVPASVSFTVSSTSTTTSTSTSTVSSHSSNPSSQLELLSSLSSGTHRLMSSPTLTGAATASRIQSLASQILVLLQEEVDAQDYSDDEMVDDDHVSVGDSDVEDDLLDVEAEP